MIQSTIQNWICDNCNITVAPVDINQARCPTGWQIISATDVNGFTTSYAICDNQQTCNKDSIKVSKFQPKPLAASATAEPLK